MKLIISRLWDEKCASVVVKFIATSVEDVVDLYHLAAGITDRNGNHKNRLKQPLKRKIGNAYNELGKDRILKVLFNYLFFINLTFI